MAFSIRFSGAFMDARTLRCVKLHFRRFRMRFTPGVDLFSLSSEKKNGQTLCPSQFEAERRGTPAGLCQTHLSCPRQTRKNAQKSAAKGEVFKIFVRTCEFSPGSSPRPP